MLPFHVHHNIDKACGCLLLGIITFVLYTSMMNHDPYHCGALLTGGHWIRSPDQWQPPNCMMRHYQPADLISCNLRRLIVIGDSTVRELFWATAKKFDKVGAEHAIHAVEKHSNVNFSRAGVDLNFIWDPFLNSSALHNSLAAYRSGGNESASILVIGGGLWHAGNLGEKYLQYYGDSMDEIMPFMSPGWPEEMESPYTETFSTAPNEENLLILAPVQIPRYGDLKPERAASITQDRVDPMNDYLRQLHRKQGAHVAWSWSHMVRQQPEAYKKDGLHVISSVAELQMDVILNMRCNSQLLNIEQQYPRDNTCCNGYAPLLSVQKFLLVAALGVLPLLTVFAAEGKSGSRCCGSDLTCADLSV